MNNGHNPSGMGYNIMGPPPFAGMHHEMQDHQPLIDVANNSAIAMGMNLDIDDDLDDKGYPQQHDNYDAGRPNATEAIQSFVLPEGYTADYVPSWSKNRSIIFDCGVKATNLQTQKTIWFCLSSPQCQVKSSKGVGIAIKGAVTNCTNHLRDIHKIISPRSAKIVRRKPDSGDGTEPDNLGGPGYKSGGSSNKRPHSLLSTTRPTTYAEAAAVTHASHSALMHPAAAGLYGPNVGMSMATMQQQQQQQQQHQQQQQQHSNAPSSSSASASSSAPHSAASNLALNESWQQYFNKNHTMKYQIIAAPGMENMAQTIAQMHPGRFLYHKTLWGKFPDGTDNIMIGGFQPVNRIAGENVLMLASFTNNSTTLTQLLVMVTLLQSFIESLTVVLPFYPVGTMERVSREGQVATASTYAQMLSNLPNCGKPTRLVIYDLHTLQNRFYLHGNAIASMQTTIPLLVERMRSTHINCIAFPDDGALKRFGFMLTHLGFEIVICGKTRGEGDKRVISIQDGRPYGKHVIVIDDLAQTGSTVYQCGMACKAAGAASVSAFLAHAVFPNHSWRSFLPEGAHYGCFDKFFVTNSVPSVTEVLPQGSAFEVLDLSRKIVDDLDRFS